MLARRGKLHTALKTWALKFICGGVASVDLRDWYWPTDARMVPHMLVRAADGDGTLRWPLRRNFSNVVLVDRLQAHMSHLQRKRLTHAKIIGLS